MSDATLLEGDDLRRFAEDELARHTPANQERNGYNRCAECHYTRHPCDVFDLAAAVLRLLDRCTFPPNRKPNTNGYITLTVGGVGKAHSGERGRRVYAHRWAWEQANGPIPDGMMVLHRCDNPACWNIDHLFLGTQADNMADMRAKKRGNPGPGRKFTPGSDPRRATRRDPQTGRMLPNDDDLTTVVVQHDASFNKESNG